MAINIAPVPHAPADRLHTPAIKPEPDAENEGLPGFGSDGFTFADLLDIINPLQHIPIISTIYRSITGDELGAIPRMVGGALFGGPIGLVTSVVSAVVEGATGKDPGEHMLALFNSDDDKTGPTILTAGTQTGNVEAAALVATNSRNETAAPPEPAMPLQLAATTSIARPLATVARIGPPPLGGHVVPKLNPGAGSPRIVAGALVDLPPLPGEPREPEPRTTNDRGHLDNEGRVRHGPPSVPIWFPRAMLGALDKYREGARLNQAGIPQVRIDR